MIRNFIWLVLFIALFPLVGHAQSNTLPLSKQDIVSRITDSLQVSNEALNWRDMDSELMWSTLVQYDSVAIIGFKPDTIKYGRDALLDTSFTTPDWIKARKKLQSRIRAELVRAGINSADASLLVENQNTNRPYLYAKIFSENFINELRSDPNVRYVEPANYVYKSTDSRAGEGCANYSVNVSPADFTTITPASIASWTHAEHDIDLAWTKSNKGKDVWIAVMDTGISANNPKFNAEFDQGASAGRVIEKKEFYIPSGTMTDGWQDQCGHGTAMAGLAVGTRGQDSTPAGVSYQANLISYRVTNDVKIDNSAEINGLRDGLYDAGDDARVDIISISLGDIFSHGPVEDGIIYAHNKGKLIFAAAGTSTSFTNWFGVIAPANMPEANAVTGVIEGTTYTRCDICHSGNEVEFCVYMQRAGTANKAVTLTNDNAANNNYIGYVGGSSSGTAIMAGIAGLIKSNHPTFSKDQILNRMIQTSSEYPNKDSAYGWGTIDVSAAVDSTLSLPCSSSISSAVSMQINTITFPPVNDGIGDPELVLKIGGNSFYFNVPNSGATGNPNAYIDDTVCDNVPIIVDLGNTVCGTMSLDVSIETHEDDGLASECDFNAGDDFQVISTETIFLNQNSFTQTTPNGDWIFSYSLTCVPLLVAGLTSNSPLCSSETLNLTASPSGETNYTFFLDSNNNGLFDAGEVLQSGTTETYSTGTYTDGDQIGIEVSDSNGCTSYSFITVQTINYIGTNSLLGIESGIADYETNDTIVSSQLIESGAVVDYDAGIQICLTNGFEIEQGAIFTAFIDGCNDGAGGENLDDGQKATEN